MSWEGILKRRAGTMTGPAKEWVDELMSDREERTILEILDEIWIMVENKRKEEESFITGKNIIPTSKELAMYFHEDERYEKAGKLRGRRHTLYQMI